MLSSFELRDWFALASLSLLAVIGVYSIVATPPSEKKEKRKRLRPWHRLQRWSQFYKARGV
ncbi:MAG: hypothetical protein CMB79_11260 [Filomicrobium sp.]|nr:hypothetical protein [Filomicrobium sp.]